MILFRFWKFFSSLVLLYLEFKLRSGFILTDSFNIWAQFLIMICHCQQRTNKNPNAYAYNTLPITQLKLFLMAVIQTNTLCNASHIHLYYSFTDMFKQKWSGYGGKMNKSVVQWDDGVRTQPGRMVKKTEWMWMNKCTVVVSLKNVLWGIILKVFGCN